MAALPSQLIALLLQGVRDGHRRGSHGEDLPSPMRRRDHRTTEDWTLTPEGTGRDRALATYSEDTRGFLSDYPAPGKE